MLMSCKGQNIVLEPKSFYEGKCYSHGKALPAASDHPLNQSAFMRATEPANKYEMCQKSRQTEA